MILFVIFWDKNWLFNYFKITKTFPLLPPPGPHGEFELSPILSIGIFIAILTVIICIIIAVAAAFKLRASQTTATKAGHHHGANGGGGVLGKRPGNLPIKEKISLPLSQSEDMYDEKNPDVVPTNEGKLGSQPAASGRRRPMHIDQLPLLLSFCATLRV